MEHTTISGLYEPGIIISDRFEIVREIASGAMGTVYLARDKRLNSVDVALKILHTKHFNDSLVFKRFANEVVVARKLTHPNIVRIYEFVETKEGDRIISMEFVAGSTLASEIASIHGDTSAAELSCEHLYESDYRKLFSIYMQMLQGMSYAHKVGILHRDLKPSNVLVTPNNDAKIADFGLATVAGVSSGLTNDGQALIGTPFYMAPEQIMGQKHSARSDVYALGIIAFEIIFGRPPFLAENAVAVAYKQVQSPFPSLDRMPSFIEPPMRELIERATRKNPHERFSSVDEMIALFQDYNARRNNTRHGSLPTQRKSGSFGSVRPSGVVRVATGSRSASPRRLVTTTIILMLISMACALSIKLVNSVFEVADRGHLVVIPTDTRIEH